ncbi:hypothetical protein [Promicromonospora iranensis]|uniref:Uncharacterized protein n=1 Tax=Promicromonospora iranensis TaxID=1105144 RepID=A0ABU2CWI1_9MICO|nr:hypothetical protein [Promicromonospora iranensis]MDR7385621.1 hypothetical protein [Promicromonospora iranensis]
MLIGQQRPSEVQAGHEAAAEHLFSVASATVRSATVEYTMIGAI